VKEKKRRKRRWRRKHDGG